MASSAKKSGPQFTGQVVVVLGGTGIIGSGIVQRFLEEGATVVVPTRSLESIERYVGLMCVRVHDS